ncbi:RING-H2 finger protein ATL79-like [Rhododendron vialii]|uniref:RING-H2 finger protein ATL79-like n=1 Tax=Rhododendron vialii TaxID=182163 RepID=UPI00265E6D31|nr:RING-H2 finger protein ATL79-like [Rhododendron vialii]XP_058202152.1 RING-H2 finger protein ATL79-like [Rhododendron vialii]
MVEKMSKFFSGRLWRISLLLLWGMLASVQGSRYRTSLWQTLHASGEASKSSPLQFGSTTPGFMNGIQMPAAQANTAPPNLDEQHNTVVKNEWHQDTQFRKPRNSLIAETVAPIVGILVLLGCCYCCWRMCANNNPEEAADPEPEVEIVGAGPTVEVGLDSNVIDIFPLLPFMIDGPVGFGESECQICLEQFVHGENVRVLPTCRHIFHDHCIKTWLASRTECAVCRHEYLGWEAEMVPPDALGQP